jgi:GNAT superfamily N-acetyltransferase
MKELVEKYKEQITAILGHNRWRLGNVDYKVNYSDKLDLGKYALWVRVNSVDPTETKVASFELHPMINCCGICVSSRAEVHKDFQGNGLGTLLNSFRVDVARYLGYGVLLCTDVSTNEPQRKILKANGWKDVYQFLNPRTKNRVFISVINL